MRRKLNVKLIGCLLGGLIVVAAAGYFLHGWQLGRNAHTLLELADQAEADKDDAKAMFLYAQYLTFVPGDVNAVQKYVQVLDRRAPWNQRPEVVTRMEQVLAAKPTERELRLRLIQNLIAIDRIPDAIAHLKKLLPQANDKAEVWHMLGWCQDAKKDYALAVVSLREALKLNPGQYKTYEVLTEVLQDRLNRPDEALQVMDDMVSANADSYEAYLLRSRFQRRRGDEKRAELDLQAALKHGPTEPAVIFEAATSAIVRAESLAARKDFTAAKKLLEETRSSYPREIIVWCALADLAANQQQWAEAERLIEQAGADKGFHDRVELRLAQVRLWSRHGTPADIAKLVRLSDADRASDSVEDRARLCRELGETWYRLGDWRRAEHFWLALTRDLRRDLPGRLYLLELALEKNELDAAHKWHEEIRAIEGDQGALTRFGAAALLVKEAHGDRQKIDAARKLIKDLTNDYRDLPRLSLLSATIFEMEGRYQQAIGEYAKALELGDMQPRTLARMLELLIQRHEFAKAESELVKYEQKAPLTPYLARLGAEVWLGMRDKQSAAVALGRAAIAVKLPSRDYRDYLWLARIHQAAGDTPKAEALLRMSIDLAGHSPNTWLALIEHLAQTNQREQALKELGRMKQTLPKERQPLAVARALESMRMLDEAAQAYRTALQATPNDAGLLASAADFHRRADRPAEAQKLYERLLSPAFGASADFAVTARRHLAVLLADHGKRAAALALIDDNSKTFGDTVADERIRLFIRSHDEQQRQTCLQKFQASAQRYVPTPDEGVLLAQMYESANDLGQARSLLAEVVDQQPTNPQYLARFARVLIKAGELDDARRIVARLEALEPTGERLDNVKTALSSAEKSLAAFP